MTIKSREDVETLERQWFKDPTWDIEDTEGFLAHREELRQFSADSKAHWAKQVKDKHKEQANKTCPEMTNGSRVDGWVSCVVDECARWDPDRYCCGMLPYKEVAVTGGINTHQY